MNKARVVASVLVGLVLSSCGGSGSSSPQSTTETTEVSSTSAAPKGPATADLQFAGDASVAGAGTDAQVVCNYPTFGGPPLIRSQVQSANPDIDIAVVVDTSKILVIAASGSGSTYSSRTFEGTGMTGFDAGTGVQIDTTLVETTPADANPGTIGAISNITGSIDCGDQTIGTSTVVFSGDTLEGAINSGPTPFRVQCDTSAAGNSVDLAGIIMVNGKEAFFFTTFNASGLITLYESFEGPPVVSHQYVADAADAVTLSENGAHVAADLVEQSPATGAAHTLHVEGDLTCGSTVNR